MRSVSRRTFCALAAGTALAISPGGMNSASGAPSPRNESLLDGYFRRFREILDTIREREADSIARAADSAVACIGHGGILYNSLIGHLFYKNGGEIGPNRIGNPVLFIRDAASAKAGDFLLTMSPMEAKRAKDKGVFVVGVTSPYFLHEETPPLALAENPAEVLRNPDNLMLSQVCDITIRTHVPVGEGILEDPRISTPLIPATSQVTAVVYWALAGEIAVRLARKGVPVRVAGE